MHTLLEQAHATSLDTRQLESLIAQTLDIPLYELWPSRYSPDDPEYES